MTRVAVCQPYFVPYAGYFRLFSTTDLFVVLDTVQFPRRHWVHRNRLEDHEGRLSWLTLPLKKGPREMLIREMAFAADAPARLRAQLRRFPVFEDPDVEDHPLVKLLLDLSVPPLGYLERLLEACCGELGFHFQTTRASALEGLEGLRGTPLIMAIAEAMGATEYVNLPAGAPLYDREEFRRRGMKLRILGDWEGSYESILGRLLEEGPRDIRREILASP